MMSFQINSDLDLEQLKSEFAQHRRLRINNFLSVESAETILDTLKNYTAWHLVYSDENGAPVRIDNNQLLTTNLDEEIVALHDRATASYQFMYKFFPIIDAIKNGLLTENSLLHEIAAFLNGTEFIRFARQLTQTDTLVKVDPQATLYESGHFLNIHDDMGDHRDSRDGSVRRYAIVLGFTKNWSVNWGGQTNFHTPNSFHNAECWFPEFNSLSIFEVPTLHSVSYVTPFASKGRYSVTGWLRDDDNIVRPDLDEQ